MSFERDVFISYAHDDNKPFTPEQKGWVTLFHSVLQTMLSQQLGKTADIWRDERLQGNEDFSAEISDQFPRTASLVSVLTPRYLKSGWCTKEIRVFCQVAAQNGGLFVRNKGRVFKVMKTPVPRTDTDVVLPPEVGKATGYEFFEKDKDVEFDPAYGEGSRQEFLVRIRRLAGDIAELLGQIRDVAHEGVAVESQLKPRVYLAECGTSRNATGRSCSRISRATVTSFPDEDLPDDETGTWRRSSASCQCQLSIHLIGNTAAPCRTATARSHRCAAERRQPSGSAAQRGCCA